MSLFPEDSKLAEVKVYEGFSAEEKEGIRKEAIDRVKKKHPRLTSLGIDAKRFFLGMEVIEVIRERKTGRCSG